MTDLAKLKSILYNQAKRGILEGYPRLDEYYIAGGRSSGTCKVLQIDSIKVGFVFTNKGRILGIYNWK